MTIHHDKMAYGKLAATREDVSDERLNEMLRLLAEDEELKTSEESEVESCQKKQKSVEKS